MLETANVWGQRVAPFVSPVVTAQIASEPWQVAAYQRLRRDIFVAEQRLFAGSDSDAQDGHAIPIVALAHVAGTPDEVVGVVRIYHAGAGVKGTWFGGRLGVCTAYRARRSVGTALIVAAVSSARALGCVEFLATVQLPNVRYFEHHHFARVEPITVCSQPHWLMRAELEAFPAEVASATRPVDGRGLGRIARRRLA
jgi:putative N-acetyltransferase (TIGR04045 family)